MRSEEHTSELQSLAYLVCRLLLEKKKSIQTDLSPALELHVRRWSDLTRILSVIPYMTMPAFFVFFFFNDTATTEIYTLSLHDALPIFTDFEIAYPIRVTAIIDG